MWPSVKVVFTCPVTGPRESSPKHAHEFAGKEEVRRAAVCVEQPCADRTKKQRWELVMRGDCPTTVKNEKHANRKSGHEYREETLLQETKAAEKANATAKA